MRILILLAVYSLIPSAVAPSYLAGPVPEPARLNIQLFPEVAAQLEKKRSIHCLATMVYGEARSESIKGQIAVAYTAKTRAKGKSVCREVIRPYQYSVFNGNKELINIALNPSLRPPMTNAIDSDSWEDAKQVAENVYNSSVEDPTNGATHYVAYKILKRVPKWTKTFKRTAKIENHTFFAVR